MVSMSFSRRFRFGCKLFSLSLPHEFLFSPVLTDFSCTFLAFSYALISLKHSLLVSTHALPVFGITGVDKLGRFSKFENGELLADAEVEAAPPVRGADLDRVALPVRGADSDVDGVALPVRGADPDVDRVPLPLRGADLDVDRVALPVRGADQMWTE